MSTSRVFVSTAGLIALSLASSVFAQQPTPPKAPTGYTDTPKIPGNKWRVHDDARPRPPVITPGTFSSSDKPGKPPSDATVLFDGTNLNAWKMAKGEPANWKLENGYVETIGRSGDIITKEEFGNCQLHIEWRTPDPPRGDSQGRGNSGVFLFGLYEIQVLDSYNNVSYADGQASGLYGQMPPLVNASLRRVSGRSTTLCLRRRRSKTAAWTRPDSSPFSITA